jgi:amino acid transporter
LSLPPVVADFLERAGWSAGQVFFATVLAGGAGMTVANLPWKYASVVALSAAIASVVLTGIQYLAKATDLTFWLDIVVRLLKTFLASLAASFAAQTPFDITTFDWTAALNVAGLAVITALGKGMLARGTVSDGPGGAPSAMNPSTLPDRVYRAAVAR